MLLKYIKSVKPKYLVLPALVLIFLIILLLFIISNVSVATNDNQNIFAYTVKVHNTVENLDKIFERAEVNVNVMVDTIASSYDVSKQQNKSYNLNYVQSINGLVKSVLANSPSVDGSWFQINADLPFSARAYNWYEFKESQFINVRDQFEGTPSMDRKITPEDDPYYFDAIDNQKPTWSDIYTDADTNNSMITISSPIYNDSTLVGVVGIDISISNLQQVLEGMQSVLGKSDLYLLDKNNKVILSQLFSVPNSKKNNYKFLELFNENKEGPIEYSAGLTKKTAIKLTLSNDYQIVIAIDNKELFGYSNRVVNVVYILFVLLIVSIGITFMNYFKMINVNQPKEIVNESVDDDNKQD